MNIFQYFTSLLNKQKVVFNRTAFISNDPKNSKEQGIQGLSFILPTRDAFELLSTCIESLLKNLSHTETEFEIIIVDNRTREVQALSYLDSLSKLDFIHRIYYDHPFNYAEMINQGATVAKFPVIVTLNNDIEFSEQETFSPLMKLIANPSIGLVAPVLLNKDRTTQSSGICLGKDGVAGHITQPLQGCAQVSAASFAFAMFRKETFVMLGGLDNRFKVGLNDVDFCLKLGLKGLHVVVCAESQVYHVGSASRGSSFGLRRIFRASLEVFRFLRIYKNLEDAFSTPSHA